MNIWYISAYDAPEGQSSRTYDFAQELTELGHKVTLFTSSFSHFTKKELLRKGEKWREEWFGDVRVIWLKTIPYKDSTLQRGVNMLSNAIRAYQVGSSFNEKPDVIFGPSVPLFTALSAYLLSKKLHSKFCFEVRDVWPQALIDLGVLKENSLITKLLNKIEIFLYKKAAAIITVLPFAYKHIMQYGIEKESITWIPNGVNLRRFAGLDEHNKREDGDKITKIMYIGGFSTTHGVDTIVETAKRFQEQNSSSVKFILVGGGKNKIKQLDRAGLFKLSNIEIRPPIPKKDIAKVQNEADILIASVKNTPVYQFGINSNKIFDYLASGKPIIFAGDSPNDPVKDAIAGITIPPEDTDAMVGAVNKLLAMSQEERDALGNNGKKYAEEHLDTKVLARKLEEIILQL